MGIGAVSRAVFRRARAGRSLAAFLVIVGLATMLMPGSASAQEWSAPRTVYVPTTGHTTDGLFLDAWRADRALLGDPVTEEFEPKAGFSAIGDADVVQYYEHLALVYLPKEEAGSRVRAIDLGRQALDEARAKGTTLALSGALERTVCSPASGASCVTIVASGHTLHEPFLSYWQQSDTSAWLGNPLTESFVAPDRSRVQYFENGILRLSATGVVEPLPVGRVAARKAQVATDPIDQPPDVPTYDEDQFTPPPAATPAGASDTASITDWSYGPGPQQGGWKEVVVSISAQMMWAYEGGELVNSSLVSTGTAETPEVTTPIGHFSILTKYPSQTMEGTISGQYYRVEDVPSVMYFDNLGDALHGTYWHNNFGTPMSHGCVNLPLDVAAWMYEWAPIGTAVSVIP
jgi:lipoprotein-anchoring transpeptidase ErfK/SrfK